MVRHRLVILLGILAVVLSVGSAGFAKENYDNPAGMSSADQKSITALRSAKAEARAEAAQKLGESACKEAVDPLIQVMQRDNDYRVRMSAGLALLKIGDTKALQAIKEQSANDANKTVRTALAGVAREMAKLDLAQR